MLTALLLAATIDCAKYASYKPPTVAVAAEKECGEGCARELAEKFANGDGVKRNFDIAAYFLCRAAEEMAPAEAEGMMQHLQRMRTGEETDHLDFCDYVTSGYGSSYCMNIQHDRVMPELDKKLDVLRTRVAAKSQFDALRERGLAYARAESERIGEQSRGGTGYAAISLGAEIEQKERFVAAVELWSKKRAPSASAAEAKRADAELNAAYRAKQKEIDDAGDEEIAEWKTFLRDAQRAWIPYRDAFAAFYAERWRGTASPENLRREIITQLTRERAAELRGDGM